MPIRRLARGASRDVRKRAGAERSTRRERAARLKTERGAASPVSRLRSASRAQRGFRCVGFARQAEWSQASDRWRSVCKPSEAKATCGRDLRAERSKASVAGGDSVASRAKRGFSGRRDSVCEPSRRRRLTDHRSRLAPPNERSEVWRRERDSNPRYGFPYTRFPSVLLQPLGHLSVYLESTVYRLVAEPANPNCVTNCVRPSNVPRSLTAIWLCLATGSGSTTASLRPSSIERSGRPRIDAHRDFKLKT